MLKQQIAYLSIKKKGKRKKKKEKRKKRLGGAILICCYISKECGSTKFGENLNYEI
jgi:hypothetical protein